MGGLARWLARQVWASILWVMRRPKVKWLRNHFTDRLPEPHRTQVRTSIIKQDAFARRYGLALLTFTMYLVILSVMISVCYLMVLRASETGLFTPKQL